MDKGIWKLKGEWLYFLRNILVADKVVFLSDYHLVLFLLIYRRINAFLNQKKKQIRILNKNNPLNNSLDRYTEQQHNLLSLHTITIT